MEDSRAAAEHHYLQCRTRAHLDRQPVPSQAENSRIIEPSPCPADQGESAHLEARDSWITGPSGTAAGRRPAPWHARNRLNVLTTEKIEITADAPQVPVGIDGEAAEMPSPAICPVLPGALSVRVPTNRPGVPAPAVPGWPLTFGWRRHNAHVDHFEPEAGDPFHEPGQSCLIWKLST